MNTVSNKELFWERAPAAPSIFAYTMSHPALAKLALEFEYGMIDEPSDRAVVKFSWPNCPMCKHVVVWVSALTRMDGTWNLTHSFGPAT